MKKNNLRTCTTCKHFINIYKQKWCGKKHKDIEPLTEDTKNCYTEEERDEK